MKRLLVALALLLVPVGAFAQSQPGKFAGLQLSANNAMPVCIAGSACIRYNSGTGLELSISGGAYTSVGGLPPLGPGPGTFTWATGDTLSLDVNGRVTAISNVTRSLLAGPGINAIGNLSADRTVSVDQGFSPTWTGVHTFSLPIVVGNGTGTTKTIQFHNAAGFGNLSWNPSTTNNLTLPDATDTLVGRSTIDTLTNKSISGLSNTLSNIANASLVNSSFTLNTTGPLNGGGLVSLGGTLTLTCTTCLVGVPTATGDIMYSTAGGQSMTALPDAVINRVLLSGGVGAPPSYGLVPNAALANSTFTVSAGPGITGGGSLSLGGSTTLSLDQAFSPTWTAAHTFNSYLDLALIAAPALPSAANIRLFASSRATGMDALAYQNVAGNQVIIGRDLLIGVRNVSGATITKGSAVYISGASAGLPRIEKALADASMSKMPALGVMPQDIANNANGFMLTRGVLSNVSTAGWAAGDTVYVDPTTAGALTNTEPAHPFVAQPIGIVELVSATVGSIMVDLAPVNLNAIDGVNGTSFAIGNGSGSTARSLLFKNSSTGTLTWTPTTARTLTLPDADGVVSLSALALTSGRIPVATTGGVLQDSNITWTAGTIDVVSGGLVFGTGVATGLTLGRSGINVSIAANTLNFSTSTGNKTLSVQQAAADTVGNNLVVAGGGGGNASATGGGIGGIGQYTGGNAGAATTSLAAGTGGQGTFGGGAGGVGAASGQGPGSGGLAIFRGGTGGTVTGGFGGGNGGNTAIRGGAATGTGTNGSVFIGDSQTVNVNITGFTGGLTLTAGTASTWDSKDGTIRATSLDRTTAGQLNLGTTNATAILVGANTTLADTKTLTQSWNNAGNALQLVRTQQNTTASTNPGSAPYVAPPGAGQPQWSPGWEMAGHAWGFRPGTVGTAQRASNVVTVSTSSAHGFASTQYVYLYNGDGNFAGGTYGPITVTDSTHFTYAQTAANAGPSVAFNWFDASGLDQTVKVAQTLRAVNGRRFQDSLVDIGQAVPELVYYRPSAPANGSYAEWFSITPGRADLNGGSSGTTGGVTFRTVGADGVTPGSFLQLSPGAGGGGFELADDVGNSLTSYPFNYGGASTPNGIPYILSGSAISPAAVGVQGYSLGHPGNRWYDVFGNRSTANNIGVGDIATQRWGEPSTTLAAYQSAATAGNYGYYQLGGGAKFQAVASVDTVAVTPTPGGGAIAWTYKVVAVDRNGNATLANLLGGSTSTGSSATLSATVFNTLSWTAVPGVAFYDVYVTSVSSTNWLGTTTTTTFKDTIGTGNSDGRYGSAATARVYSVVAAGTTGSGGTGSATIYYVSAVDADGHKSSATAFTAGALTPSLASPVLLQWKPVGGAVKYVIARGLLTSIIGGTDLQTYSNGLANVGPYTVPIGGLVRSSGTTVTVTVAAGHGLKVNDSLTLTSSDPLFAAGPYTVSTTPSATQFTYASSGTNGSSTLATTIAGPTGVPGTTFVDYAFPARTVGTATRNATADVSVDGFVNFSGPTAAVPGTALIPFASFANSWITNTNSGYWKDALGVVHLVGSVKSGTINTAMFTLPPGYRPVGVNRTFTNVSSSSGASAVTAVFVDPSGNVYQGLAAAGFNVSCNLDGVTFLAEQ